MVELEPSAFCERLVSWNGLEAAGFAGWEFLPGMRLGERAIWWRDGGVERGEPHEGLDLCWFRTRDGRRAGLGAGARVPAAWAGEVVAVVDDFLGASVFVAHERRDERGWRLHSVYGHVRPRLGIAPGTLLHDGDEIGVVALAPGNRRAVPPHLHLTLALVDRAGGPARLDWTVLRDRSRVLLLDPVVIMK
jgi:murein DD-endopeptidase MepM/ murein hydrolase activator NlpD